MTNLKKVSRLLTVETRFEAWLVIYAIALGAIERGRVYLLTYPGWGGWLLALACTAVVFVAGGKLLEAVTHEGERNFTTYSRNNCCGGASSLLGLTPTERDNEVAVQSCDAGNVCQPSRRSAPHGRA